MTTNEKLREQYRQLLLLRAKVAAAELQGAKEALERLERNR